MCSKEAEFKAVLFSLCYFHASIQERSKFGPQGWNRSYPFNVGDLIISINVLYNYLESNNKVPWEDLRYLFGEIMYGGHITDDWDRRLCRTYLEVYMNPELVLLSINLYNDKQYSIIDLHFRWKVVFHSHQVLLPLQIQITNRIITTSIYCLLKVLYCMDFTRMLKLAPSQQGPKIYSKR